MFFVLSALFACINKENISSWNTDWPLNGILAFFSFNLFQTSDVLLTAMNWFMQNTTGKARTQCENPKLYILQLTFWVLWMTGKSQLQRARSLWSMKLCLADLWLLPDSVCRVLDCSMKDGTESRAWHSPLTSFFRQVLLLLCSCWAWVFGLHGSVPIHTVKEQQCFLHENNTAWAVFCYHHIWLCFEMSCIRLKASVLGLDLQLVLFGVALLYLIDITWRVDTSAATRNGAFPCHGTLWQHCAQTKETWIWNSPNNQHTSQWQIMERYKKPRF